MTNFNGQLPPDTKFEDVNSQKISNEKEKENKNVFDNRNYLDFTIPKGQTSKEVTIRLLPININNGNPEFFQIVHLHNITVNKELNPNKSGKKAYMCLSSKNTGVDHNTFGSKCPICEYQNELWKQWHEETDPIKKTEITKEIGGLNTREYCIVRCIERGKENEGPKFWRIPLRQDKTDAYHQIIMLGETRHKEGLEEGLNINIYSIYEGRDLTITFNDGNGAPVVVDKSISKPLTKNNEELIKWYYDEKKWSDVFSTKSYDYLKLVFEGEVPWFDKENNRWVKKQEFEELKNKQEISSDNEIKQAESKIINSNLTKQETVTSSISLDDELPF